MWPEEPRQVREVLYLCGENSAWKSYVKWVVVCPGILRSGGEQMDRSLVDIARRLDTLDDRREIGRALDELEFLYDALDSEQQDLASQLMAALQGRLRSFD